MPAKGTASFQSKYKYQISATRIKVHAHIHEYEDNMPKSEKAISGIPMKWQI